MVDAMIRKRFNKWNKGIKLEWIHGLWEHVKRFSIRKKKWKRIEENKYRKLIRAKFSWTDTLVREEKYFTLYWKPISHSVRLAVVLDAILRSAYSNTINLRSQWQISSMLSSAAARTADADEEDDLFDAVLALLVKWQIPGFGSFDSFKNEE